VLDRVHAWRVSAASAPPAVPPLQLKGAGSSAAVGASSAAAGATAGAIAGGAAILGGIGMGAALKKAAGAILHARLSPT
jgi:hypothetical protein